MLIFKSIPKLALLPILCSIWNVSIGANNCIYLQWIKLYWLIAARLIYLMCYRLQNLDEIGQNISWPYLKWNKLWNWCNLKLLILSHSIKLKTEAMKRLIFLIRLWPRSSTPGCIILQKSLQTQKHFSKNEGLKG